MNLHLVSDGPIGFVPDDFVAPGHVGYAWSLVIGIGWLVMLCGGLIVWLFVKAVALSKAHAREEKEMRERAARPLSSGPHRVVFGRVELDEGEDVAIELEIDQTVRDHSSKNGKWHTWNETHRELRKAPFYLVRSDGETVYVDPPDDLLMVDELETRYPIDAPRTRVRTADVRRGEHFFVYGDLDRGSHPRAQNGYRDGSGWILRSPRQRMLLATEAIRGRYRDRISYLYQVGGVAAVIFVILHAWITAPFLSAAFFGTRTTGRVTNSRTWVTTNKNTKTTHYSLTVETPDGVVITREVAGSAYAAVAYLDPGDDAAVVPVLETNHSPDASYLGFEPDLYVLWLFSGVLASIAAIVLTVTGYRSRVPWYDRPKLKEHGGSGFWVETRPHFPIT